MEAPKQLSAESQSIFREGIGLVLSQWSALRLAVENEWGGRDSSSKAEQLGSHIFSWFTQSKEPLYLDDLENMLDEGMITLNTMAEDGSVEEVAEKLMIMHEECLDGNFSSIGSLRETSHKRVAHPHVRQVVNEDDDDDEDGDDEEEDDDDDIRDGNMASNDSTEMMVDEPQSLSNVISTNIPVAEPTPKVEAEDGWTVVGRRRNSSGKRN